MPETKIIPKSSIAKLNSLKQDMKNQINKLNGNKYLQNINEQNESSNNQNRTKQIRPKSTPNKYSFK